MANIRTAMLARKTPRRVTEDTLARRGADAIVVGDAVVSAVAAAAASGDDAIVSLSHSNHTQKINILHLCDYHEQGLFMFQLVACF